MKLSTYFILSAIAILCLVISPLTAFAQNAFITTWQTNSTNESITIPTSDNGGLYGQGISTYNFTIDWGDGTVENITGDDPDPSHTYTAAGIYTVSITGTFPHFYMNDFFDEDPNTDKLQSIEQWGTIEWESLEAAFAGAENMMYNAADAPDLTNATNMSFMFFGASAFNQNIGGWDVSSVTRMRGMFSLAVSFDQDISNWNVTSVKDMSSMFSGASAFNQDIGGWDVSSVTRMIGMFSGASAFNQDIGGWDVSSVRDISWMFNRASAFNQDIGGWDVSSVSDMAGLFDGASTFNQDIGNWNVRYVRYMNEMFDGASAFNQDIGGWDVSSVRSMSHMFYGAREFNQDISGWNVQSVWSMSWMFRDASAFNQDIGGWDVSSVTNMTGMFSRASAFDQDIDSWNVENVFHMDGMFNDASAFNQDIGGWDVKNVTRMGGMFDGASAFNQDIANWDVSNVDAMLNMFNGATSFDQDLSKWNVSNVTEFDDFLTGVQLSPENYDGLLIGWEQLNLQDGLTFDAGNSQYTAAAQTARQAIINDDNWTINDGGLTTNSAPTTTNADVFATLDMLLLNITTSDIPYSDSNGDPLTQIQVTSLPSTGTLGIDANQDGTLTTGEPLAIDDIVSKTDLDDGKLVWSPPAGMGGYRVDSFNFTVSDGNDASSEATMYLSLEAIGVELSGTAGQDGWHMLANPWDSMPMDLLENIWTQGATGADVSSGTPNVYTFDEPTASYQPVADLTQPLSDGQGLAVYIYADDNYDGSDDSWPKTLSNSTGNPLEAPLDITISNTDSDGAPGLSNDEGWNLIGNPFGTPIEVDSVIAALQEANASPNNSVYIWDKTLLSGTGDWAILTYENDEEVAAYQAMFIRAQNSGMGFTPIILENDDRSTDDPNFLKEESETPSGELQLLVSHVSSELEYPAALRFSQSASLELDPNDIYSLWPLSEQFVTLYSQVGDQALKVNSMPMPASEPVSIPLAVEATEPDAMILSWERQGLPEDLYFKLTDTETGEEILLNSATSYPFEYSAGAITKQREMASQQPVVSSKAKDGQSRFLLTIQQGTPFPTDQSLANVPAVFELKQNFPNPFNPNTRIEYALPDAADVTLKVFDVAGREVATIVNQPQTAGIYTVNWDASGLASGMYIYQLITGKQTITKKMMLIK